MTTKFKINPHQSLPQVFARIRGKHGSQRVRLVFDTGAFMTQIATSVIEELGYSARDGIRHITAYGPSGPIDEGYSVRLSGLEVLSKQFHGMEVAVYDFNNLETEGIAGLLGFDIIKQLHLEMNGPKGELIIY